MIAIVDYGAGNLMSIKNALDFIKVKSKITDNAEEIVKADKIIFPGVGNFGNVMSNLEDRKLTKTIKKFIESKKPFLGICIGLQILFEESEESPGIKGLGILKGRVARFKKGKIPQIGWNFVKSKDKLIKDGYYYFVNSFYVTPEDKSVILAETDYFAKFTSAIKKDNIIAMQFHPEKSGSIGLKFLTKWCRC